MRRITSVILLVGALALFGSAWAQEKQRALPKGKLLTSRLPRGVEGVTLESSGVRLRSGYKFVKQPSGAMTVARIGGGASEGPGAIGMFNCMCANGTPGPCMVVNTGNSLICMTMNPAQCQACILQVTIFGAQTKLMAFESAAAGKAETKRPEVKATASPTPLRRPTKGSSEAASPPAETRP